MKAIDYLKKGWCRERIAKTAMGKWCEPNDENAAAWCAVGAIKAAYPDNFPEMYFRISKIVRTNSSFTLSDWNDSPYTTHEMVLAAFEKAGI